MRPGLPGLYWDEGIWTWWQRSAAITLRELKALRITLSRTLGTRFERYRAVEVLCHNDNRSVVHIMNSFVSSSPDMMAELRRLKVLLDKMGVRVRAEWLPSALNRYADALSRRLPRQDLQILPQLPRSVAAGVRSPRDVFPYRPIGEPSFLRRRYILAELDHPWTTEETLVLYPPPDLITPVVRRLRLTGAPALLIIPGCPPQQWHQAALQLSSHWERLEAPPSRV